MAVLPVSRRASTTRPSVMCGGHACVARKDDGTAVAWGDSSKGGDASGVDLTTVAHIWCGVYACVALKNDGSAEAWGGNGGNTYWVDLTNVADISCGAYACVARKNDGSAEARDLLLTEVPFPLV